MAKTFTPEQGNWKFYDDDAAEPTTQLEDENVQPSLANNNDIFRLRLALIETGGAGYNNGYYKIQHSQNETDWTDLGASAHFDYANGQATEDNLVTGNKLSDCTVQGPYRESAGQTTFDVDGSAGNEFDFAIVPTSNVASSDDYYFRMMYSDDGASWNELTLGSGKSHPILTTAAGVTQYNFADTLGLTSNTADAKLNKIVDYADALALTSNTADADLFRIVDFLDTLDLTSNTADANLSIGAVIDFADALALTTLTSDAKLTVLKDFADTLALTSNTADAAISVFIDFADTLNLTSLTGDAKLNLLKNFADILALTSLTGDAKLYRLIPFADVLALTSLTGDAELSGLTVDFSDTLNLTSLTGDAKLTRILDFLDTLDLTSLTADAILTVGQIYNFADTLALTSLTADGELAIGVWIQDPVELYRWNGAEWVAADGLSWIP